MSDNWIALLCAIVTEKSIDESLKSIGIRPKRTQKQKLILSDNDFEIILFLKKEKTWNELSEEFGVTSNYLCSLCNEYKKRKAIEGASITLAPSISFNKKSIIL